MLCDSIGAVYPFFILSPGDGHVRSNGCGPCASLHPGPSSPGVSGADGSVHPLNRRCDLYHPITERISRERSASGWTGNGWYAFVCDSDGATCRTRRPRKRSGMRPSGGSLPGLGGWSPVLDETTLCQFRYRWEEPCWGQPSAGNRMYACRPRGCARVCRWKPL